MFNFTLSDKPEQCIESLPLLQKLWVLLSGITLSKPQNDERPDDYGLSFEVHQLQSDSLTLEAWFIPASIPASIPAAGAAGAPKGTVILFHGYGGCKSGVLGEAKAFHTLGYDTFLVDFRGCGDSDGNLTTIGFWEGRDVAAAFRYVQALRQQTDLAKSTDLPILLYGRSMGAASILRAMATTDIEPDAIMLDAVFAEMVTAVKNRFRAINVPPFPAAHAMIFWGGLQNGFFGFGHNPVEYASKVTVPTLVMHGAADQMATLDEGERVFEAVQSTRKHFVCFEKAGHEPYLPLQPELWYREVPAFLAVVS